MAEEESGFSSQENLVHRNSEEDLRELMERFSVTEEDVQVAIQIVGDRRERVEKYLEHKRRWGLSNIW